MAKPKKDVGPIQVTGTEKKGETYIVHFDHQDVDDVEISVADAKARAAELGHDAVEWPLLGQMAKEKLGL